MKLLKHIMFRGPIESYHQAIDWISAQENFCWTASIVDMPRFDELVLNIRDDREAIDVEQILNQLIDLIKKCHKLDMKCYTQTIPYYISKNGVYEAGSIHINPTERKIVLLGQNDRGKIINIEIRWPYL